MGTIHTYADNFLVGINNNFVDLSDKKSSEVNHWSMQEEIKGFRNATSKVNSCVEILGLLKVIV
jgi:hypothetical protein